MDSTATAPPWSAIFGDLAETERKVALPAGVPEALIGGTLVRNGGAPSPEWTHLFDGDGLLRSFHFSSAHELEYRSRYVDTRRRQRIAKGDPPRVFGFGSLEKRLLPANPKELFEANNTSNTNVIRMGDELLTLIESGAPYAVDPKTLETLGQRTYDGKFGATRPLSAHPHQCSITGETYNFGMLNGPRPALRTLRHTAKRGVEILDTIELPFAPIVHDFALTRQYLVFCLGNLRITPKRAIKLPFGYATVHDILDWELEAPSTVVLAPRDGSAPLMFEGPPYTVFHIAGANERDGEVFVHLHRTHDPKRFANQIQNFRTSDFAGQMSTLCELRVDTRSGKVALEELSDLSAEFPYLDGRYATSDYDRIYAAITPTGRNGLPCAIGAFDLTRNEWQICDFGDGRVVTEPVFAADPGSETEGAGWLLTTVFDPTRGETDLAILDARHLNDGPICSAELGVNAGFSFHGFFDAPN